MEAEIVKLWDREMIRDCLYRYCRGIDRVDEALLRSSYWPDGTDTHGAYRGSASGFVDWAMAALPKIERGIHQIHNILIEMRGTEAAVESYFSAWQRQPGADGALVEAHMAGAMSTGSKKGATSGASPTALWSLIGSRSDRRRRRARPNASGIASRSAPTGRTIRSIVCSADH